MALHCNSHTRLSEEFPAVIAESTPEFGGECALSLTFCESFRSPSLPAVIVRREYLLAESAARSLLP